MRLVEYGRDPQEAHTNYATPTPPLNPLSTSTSASEALSGPETVVSEDPGLASPDRGHVTGTLLSSGIGIGTKSVTVGLGVPLPGGVVGKAGVKQTYYSPPSGGRDDKSLEDLLH